MMLYPRDIGSADMHSFGCPSHLDWVTKFLIPCVYDSIVSPLVCEMNKQYFLNVIFGTHASERGVLLRNVSSILQLIFCSQL